MYNVYLNNVKHGETNEKQYLVPNLETGREHEFRVHDGVNEDTVRLLVPIRGAIQLQLVEPTFTGAKIRWDIPTYNEKVVKYNIYNNGIFVGETKGNTFEFKSGIFNPTISLTMAYETTDGKTSASSEPLVVIPLSVSQLRLSVDPNDITNNSVKVGSTIRVPASDVIEVKLETLESEMLASDSITHDIQKVQFINLTSGKKYRLQGYLLAHFGTSQQVGFNIPNLTFTTV